MDMEAGSNWNF
jgi:hypothetical protein